MKRVLRLVLTIIIVLSNSIILEQHAALAKSHKSKRRRPPISNPKSAPKVLFKNVCDDSKNIVPGRLIITLKENPKHKHLRTRMGLQKIETLRHAESINTLRHKVTQVKNLRPLFEIDYDVLNQEKLRLKAITNPTIKNKSLEQIRIERKLKFYKSISSSSITRSYILDTDATNCSDLQKIVNKLANDPSIEKIQLDLIVRASSLIDGNPNDTHFQNKTTTNPFPYTYADGAMWNIKKIKANNAWGTTTGEFSENGSQKNIIVAVIDSGVDYTHPDINDNILRNSLGQIVGYDYINNDGDPKDDNGHGTHVAGTIAAEGDNNLGVVGVAPKAKIMPIKALDAKGYNSGTATIDGIQYAIDNHADVINMSLGSNPTIEDRAYVKYFDTYDVIIDALNAGITVVVAAGNENIDVYEGGLVDHDNDGISEHRFSLYPLIPGVIAVGASTETDERARRFSNYGRSEYLDIAAPGGSNVDTIMPDKFLINRSSVVANNLDSFKSQLLTYRSNILSLKTSSNSNFYRYSHYVGNTEGEPYTYEIKHSTLKTITPVDPKFLEFTIDNDFKIVNKDYYLLDGTSMAAPHVAGAAALLLSLNPDLTPQQVRDILVETGDTIYPDQPIGPRLNVQKAVERVQAIKSLTAPIINEFRDNGNGKATASWSRVTNATKYEYIVDDQAYANTTGNISITVPAGAQKLSAGQHTIKVKACIGNVCGPESSATVDMQISTPTNISFIAVNNTTANAQAKWDTVIGANIYKYQIDSNPEEETTLTTLSKTLSTGTHSFRVKACDSQGACSAYSNSISLTIQAAGEITSILITSRQYTVENRTIAQDKRPTFSWNTINSSGVLYRIAYQRGIDPEIVLSNAYAGSTYNFTNDLSPGIYTFKVASSTDGGINFGDYKTKVFVIANTANRPNSVIVTSPLQNSNVTRAEFAWQAASNAAFYEIKITPNPAPANYNPQIIELNDLSYLHTDALAPGNYSLTIRAFSYSGYGNPTTINFTKLAEVTEAPDAVIFPSNQFVYIDGIDKPILSTRKVVWNTVTNAHSYKVSLTKPNLESLSSELSGNELNLNPISSYPSGNYHLTVTASNNLGDSEARELDFILALATENTPIAPTITSPQANSITSNKRPTITWSKSSGAFSYEISLEQMHPTTKVIEDNKIIETESYTSDSDLDVGKYKFKVKAINSSGRGAETEIEFYITETDSSTKPANVNLIKPSINEITNNTKPVIEWDAIPGVAYYEVRITSISGISPASTIDLQPVEITGTSYQPEFDLPFGKYQINIRARNSAGFSNLSTVRMFSVVPNPVSFNNSSSTIQEFDYQVIIVTGTAVTWTSATGATSYSVVVDGKIAISQTTTSYTLPTSLTAGAHTLTVTPKFSYSDGLTSRLNFIAAPKVTARPGLVTISTPSKADGSIVFNTASPEFVWKAVSGAIGYQITITQNFPTVDDIVVDKLVTAQTLKYKHTSNLGYGIYTIKVKAINALGAGDYGTGYKFKITSPGITKAPTGSVTITGPVGTGNPTIISETQPVITWNSVTNIDYYELTLLKFNAGTNSYLAINSDPIILNSTSYQWAEGLETGSYKVVVKAVNGYGSTTVPADSAKYTFIVANPSLSQPSLIDINISSSIDGSNPVIVSNKRPLITWTGSDDIAYYDIKVINATTKAVLGTALTATPATSYLVTSDLVANTLYQVVLTAYNSAGKTESTKNFFLGAAPTSLTVSPISADIVSARKPKFTWKAPTGTISNYQIQIVDAISGDIVQDPSTTNSTASFTLSSDLANGFYKVRVRAVHPLIGAGPWSSDLSFYVDASSTSKPSQPVITEPKMEAIGSNLPTIVWNPIPGAVYYKVEIFRSSSKTAFSTTATYTKTVYNTNSHKVEISLATNNSSQPKYQVKVTAYNAKGASTASTFVKFLVQ